MPIEKVSFVKTLVTFEIVYAADPFLPNMTDITCLRWLTVDILNRYQETPVDDAEFGVPIFQDHGSFPHGLPFFAFLTHK